MKLPGEVTITRNNHREWHIRLTDGRSRTEVVDIQLTDEQFANALASSLAECEFDLHATDRVGKLYEHKTVLVPRLEGYRHNRSAEELSAHLAPYETDGWQGRGRDLTNPHNYRGDEVAVTFVRWVEAPSD